MLAAMKQDRSEHFNRVPKVTVDFWLVKLMAVTMGETAADYLAVNLGLGLGAPIPFNVCNIVRSGVAPLPSTAEQPTFWDMPCVRPCFKPPGTTNCEIQRDQTQWVVTIASEAIAPGRFRRIPAWSKDLSVSSKKLPCSGVASSLIQNAGNCLASY